MALLSSSDMRSAVGRPDRWEPSAAYVEAANVTRLMRRHRIASLDELRRRSVADIAWYWDAVVDDLGIPFRTPYQRVVDTSRGPQWARWFLGGRINIVDACLDRWREDAGRADQAAIIAETEDGQAHSLTYRELAEEVDRVAGALLGAGIGKGDAVGVFMPMIAEAVVAAYAIAKIGAVYVPIFSGYAPEALGRRLANADVRLVFTAAGSWRRGKPVPVKAICDEAVRSCPSVRAVVVVEREGHELSLEPGRDLTWSEFASRGVPVRQAADTAAEDVFMLAYTSGTTGRPKGAVHVHGGFTVKIASEVAYSLDLHPGERLLWVTDMGWIMGAFSTIGAHALGGTLVMQEGAPDYPDPDRLWASAERHRVAVLGVSPTLIRGLRAKGLSWATRHDLGALRIAGSTGEPWNPEPYRWLAHDVLGGRVPIMNISGGTEVGACLLTPYPVETIKECSLGGPSLGMDLDVLDAGGQPVRDQVGELVCRQPWPSMTRGIWKDPDRYLETYWATFAGVWRHGDWARVDEDGQWFLTGRSDETINVAGKRVGPAEVESILVEDDAVAEAAAVGVPDATKGEAIWCFWVPIGTAGAERSDQLAERVAQRLGRPFKPARVVCVPDLPKTRSAKIMRRALRALAAGTDSGDSATAEDPRSLGRIRAILDGAGERSP